MNPWSKIEKPQPQIIKFDSNGDVIKNNVPAKHIINIKELSRSMRNNKNLKEYLRMDDPYKKWNATTVFNEIQYLINKLYETEVNRPQHKLKILTHCNKKRTMCRFLSCPHIEDHCTLCEVIMDETNTNSTTCEKFSTKFLFSQINVIFRTSTISHLH